PLDAGHAARVRRHQETPARRGARGPRVRAGEARRMTARAWVLTALLLAAPGIAHAQIFVADKSAPAFTLGPLFVRASVDPKLGPVKVDISFSVVVPPNAAGAGLEQDLYLLWPGEVLPDPKLGATVPALEKDLTERGFTVIGGGRLALTARNPYQVSGEGTSEPLPGGAPFVTFVREGGAPAAQRDAGEARHRLARPRPLRGAAAAGPHRAVRLLQRAAVVGAAADPRPLLRARQRRRRRGAQRGRAAEQAMGGTRAV